MRPWCSTRRAARKPATFPKAPAGRRLEGNLRGPSAAFSKKAKKARSWLGSAREEQNPLLVEGTFRTATQ